MTIPTPSAFAKRLTQQKQHEMQLAAEEKERAKIEKSATYGKDSKSSGSRSAKNESSRSSSAKAQGSVRSRSSRKDKAPATSSKADSEKESTTKDSSKVTATEKSDQPSPSIPKKAFVRKPHLTQRPLLQHEGLQALKDSLPQNRNQNHKGGRPPKKSSTKPTGRTSKKK